ncbi:endonuclease/exonuclease/phosphatase family protein [Luteolibacter sp. LG18]|uniref:endonuclease/exonuclease/phosphatase family protein n=1 Tax=Luteolibacter sp. LG18 TaxID=2819286 RepID=UPI002B2F554B|nr:endonuclease [Luteolibacter sp. LG18]
MTASRSLRWLAVWLALAAPAVAEPLRVMTFNLRYINRGDHFSRAWTARRDQVAEIIRRDHPDVLGVQEALRPMLDDLGQRLDGYVEIGVGREDGLQKGEYSALLVRADRFSIQQTGTFWLSDTPETVNSKSWGNTVVRICTWARLWDRKTSRVIHFYNTHMDHESQPAREKGIALILDRIAARQPAGPFLLTGDLNSGQENPVQELIRTSASRPLDVWKTVHPDESASVSGTMHGFTGKTDGGRIDYIYASPDLKLVAADILHDAKDGVWPSDHFPVRATLEIEPQPGQAEPH